MSRENRKVFLFVIVAVAIVFFVMVVGALLVDPNKPAEPEPTPVVTGSSVECKPYQNGVICISATSVTR